MSGAILPGLFRSRRSVAIFVATLLAVYIFFTLSANSAFLGELFRSDIFTGGTRWHLVIAIFLSPKTSFTLFSSILAIIVGLMLGLNVMLIDYVLRVKRRTTRSAQRHSLGGFLASMLGIGCAACGTALIGPLFALFGSTGLLALLPLHGQEFALIAIILLGTSITKLIHLAHAPNTCPSENDL